MVKIKPAAAANPLYLMEQMSERKAPRRKKQKSKDKPTPKAIKPITKPREIERGELKGGNEKKAKSKQHPSSKTRKGKEASIAGKSSLSNVMRCLPDEGTMTPYMSMQRIVASALLQSLEFPRLPNDHELQFTRGNIEGFMCSSKFHRGTFLSNII